MQTLSYDARDVVITWGELELEGAAPGTFVTVTYNEDAVTLTAGAQGFMVATINANDSGAMTWTASQAAPVNDRLSAYAALQRTRGVGLIKKPLFLKHRNGTSIAVGPEAWIMKEPEAPFADEHQNREWSFTIPHLTLHIGGSTR